ncbi:MAG TPA: BTAD domain-containing putative transcriptional regulator [Ktedonosporobacter sp.]|jgi:DNA-binding SARP family transcriptional activator|nr:BTAD domain-containing putative transcriptional regulator [Ktedonosporobacter sp.]
MQFEEDIAPSCQLRVCLYGPLDVWQREAAGTWTLVAKDAWGKGRAARSVFKRLLTAPGRRLARGTMQDDLWPDSDNFELADNTVYNAINRIRRVIGKTALRTIEAAYELADQSLIWTDRDACEALLKEAENQGRSSLQALPLLERALGYLERGELLEGESGTWVYSLRKHSEDRLRQCRLWLAQAYEEQGKLWQAGEQYRAMVLKEPPDEEALQHWLEMLVRHGKRQEAVKCYRDTKEAWEARGFTLSSAIEQAAIFLNEQPYRELFVSPQTAQSSIGNHQAKDTDIVRRQLLQGFLGIAGAPLFSGRISSISTDMLPLFAVLTDVCRQLSQGNELSIAEQILWTYLPKIELLARVSSEKQKEAAHITSQGYLLAASLVGHRDNLLSRLHYSEQALHFGKLADNLNLQVVAMRQIAISFDYLGHPDQVLGVYQQALPRLNDVSPLLQACIYADLSGTYTQLKQEKEAKRFLRLAYEQFPTYQEKEEEFLSTICRYATLILCEGLHHLNFNRPREAARVFAQIDGLRPKLSLPERIRLDLLNCQAETFWALGDLEQACLYLETAIQSSTALGSERRLKESFTLFQQMQRTWQREPCFVKLQSLFPNHFVKDIQ